MVYGGLSGLSLRATTCGTCYGWVYLISPWWYRWNCLLLIEFNHKSKKFVTGVENKATSDSNLNDSPGHETSWLLQLTWHSFCLFLSSAILFAASTYNVIAPFRYSPEAPQKRDSFVVTVTIICQVFQSPSTCKDHSRTVDRFPVCSSLHHRSNVILTGSE